MSWKVLQENARMAMQLAGKCRIVTAWVPLPLVHIHLVYLCRRYEPILGTLVTSTPKSDSPSFIMTPPSTVGHTVTPFKTHIPSNQPRGNVRFPFKTPVPTRLSNVTNAVDLEGGLVDSSSNSDDDNNDDEPSKANSSVSVRRVLYRHNSGSSALAAQFSVDESDQSDQDSLGRSHTNDENDSDTSDGVIDDDGNLDLHTFVRRQSDNTLDVEEYVDLIDDEEYDADMEKPIGAATCYHVSRGSRKGTFESTSSLLVKRKKANLDSSETSNRQCRSVALSGVDEQFSV